jgi:hypothetical protein
MVSIGHTWCHLFNFCYLKCKALRENFVVYWRAPYIHQSPSFKLGGILCLLLKGGREIMPTHRCKNPPIRKPHGQHRFCS